MAYTASTVPLTLIVAATAKDLGIGLHGQLPWRLRREMQYFAHVTTHPYPRPTPASALATTKPFNAVIMGRTTWESIPPKFRPLRGRLNIVLSRSATLEGLLPAEQGRWYGPGQAVQAVSLDAALDLVSTIGNGVGTGRPDDGSQLGRVFVIGGSSVYQQAIKLAQTQSIMLTQIKTDFECDAFFPHLRILDPADHQDKPVEPGCWLVQPTDKLEQLIGRSAPAENENGIEYEYRLLDRTDGGQAKDD